MRRVLMVLYGVYAWAVLIGCVLLATTLVAFVPGLRRRRQIARLSARAVFRLTGVRISMKGKPLHEIGPCVVVSNHASYLDGIILTAALPPNFSFLVKREMKTVPVASLLLRRLGTEFVDRFDYRRGAADARRIIRAASGGHGLAAFPEGSFRRQPGLGQFYSGAFSAAVRSGLTVIPLTILGSRDILPAKQNLPVPGNLEIVVHPAIAPAGTGREEIVRVRELARERILSALEEPDLGFRLARPAAAD